MTGAEAAHYVREERRRLALEGASSPAPPRQPRLDGPELLGWLVILVGCGYVLWLGLPR